MTDRCRELGCSMPAEVPRDDPEMCVDCFLAGAGLDRHLDRLSRR